MTVRQSCNDWHVKWPQCFHASLQVDFEALQLCNEVLDKPFSLQPWCELRKTKGTRSERSFAELEIGLVSCFLLQRRRWRYHVDSISKGPASIDMQYQKSVKCVKRVMNWNGSEGILLALLSLLSGGGNLKRLPKYNYSCAKRVVLCHFQGLGICCFTDGFIHYGRK